MTAAAGENDGLADEPRSVDVNDRWGVV